MNNSALIRQIRISARQLEELGDRELAQRSSALKYQAQSGANPKDLISAAFPLVVEAARRRINQVHYDVQLYCGIEMVRGRIAEMKTGEGKTLAASLVAYVFGLFGNGVHVVTFNDYLADRDCELLRPVYQLLGLSVDVLKTNLPDESRKTAYLADITYGAAKEFGFDFLRDRLKIAETGKLDVGVMRGTKYALVDEADSILLDEARTPLIIGLTNQSGEKVVQTCYRWAAEHAGEFVEDQDYKYDYQKQSVKLTGEGIRRVRNLPQNEGTVQVSIRQLYDFVQNGIKAKRDFQLDKHYAIRDGEIVIIDEFTGRLAEGRQWQKGIHQSVQAKEDLEITPATRQAATVTIQSFFRLYTRFCGMTGTAWTSRREFRRIYKKRVSKIPTHRPIRREHIPVRVFHDANAKFDAIVTATRDLIEQNRSVLIGTRSVKQSEFLSEKMLAVGLEHVVLNAKKLESEANVVMQAGQPRRVTVATNMAGRGTDIKLHPDVRAAGGLHVILSEIHESQRIDWQLIGRGSRQGEPGSFQIFVSLNDEILLLGLGKKPAIRLGKKYLGRTIPHREAFQYFQIAQRRVERKHLVDRLIVLHRDRERQKALFDTGQDPYLNVVSS